MATTMTVRTTRAIAATLPVHATRGPSRRAAPAGVAGEPPAAGFYARRRFAVARYLEEHSGAAALLPRLREARRGQDRAPERAFWQLVELLGLERQARHAELMAGRQRLRDAQPALYAAYMKSR